MELTKLFGAHHPAILEYKSAVDKKEKDKAGDDEGVSYGGLARLGRLLGADHEEVKVYEARVQSAMAKRPPEEVLHAKCKFIDSLEERIS